MMLSSLASSTTTLSADAAFPATAASPAAGHLPSSTELSSSVPLSFEVPPFHDAGMNSYRFAKIFAPPPFSPITGVDCAGSSADFSTMAKTMLPPQSTTLSALSPSTAALVVSGSGHGSSTPSQLPVSDIPLPPPAPSYADRVKGAGPPPPSRSSLIFTVAASAMRVSKDNGVCVRASSSRASLQDYAEALIAYGVPAHQLTDLSRVGGMVQAFFKDSSWARQLLQTGLAFRTEHLDVLPIGVAPRSVTVSDVPPWVPDFVVKAVLGRYGDVRGRVRSLPVSLSLPGVGAVRSNRRVADVIFASPADFAALPARETITVNGESLVLSYNVPLTCRKCGLVGHPVKSCPRLLAAPEIVSRPDGDVLHSASSPLTTARPVDPPPMELVDLSVPPMESDAPELSDPTAPSAVAMDTDMGFTVVSSRRQRSNAKRPISPSGASADLTASMPPPSHPPKRNSRRPKYTHDVATNTWRDQEGVFSPILSLSSLKDFIDHMLTCDDEEVLSYARDIAPDDASILLLARQFMVYAYSDPRINAFSATKKKRARHAIYRLACAYREDCGLASESDSSTF